MAVWYLDKSLASFKRVWVSEIIYIVIAYKSTLCHRWKLDAMDSSFRCAREIGARCVRITYQRSNSGLVGILGDRCNAVFAHESTRECFAYYRVGSGRPCGFWPGHDSRHSSRECTDWDNQIVCCEITEFVKLHHLLGHILAQDFRGSSLYSIRHSYRPS